MVGVWKQQAEKRGAEREARGHFADDLGLPKPVEGGRNEAREANNHRNLDKKQGIVEHLFR
jgi:hypothetical protein